MTEAEWLAWSDPRPMLEFLGGRPGDRKLQLFMVACCYPLRGLLTDERSEKAVRTAEQHAEGKASSEELKNAEAAAWAATRTARTPAEECAALAAEECASARADRAAVRTAWATVAALWWAKEHIGVKEKLENVQKSQCDLLRCIIGNPFHPLPTIDQAWFTWNDGTIAKIGQAIYEDRRFQDLPILADALEDAGCTNEDILTHCRSPGPHVRGCWVVDLLLGKT